MATSLRIELGKAGFTIGAVGTTMVVQDYAQPSAGGTSHATVSGSHVITSTDPILDLKFANGYEWNGARHLVAYDANNIYIVVSIPYVGCGFKAFPLSPAAITGTMRVPYATGRFNPTRRPSQASSSNTVPAGSG